MGKVMKSFLKGIGGLIHKLALVLGYLGLAVAFVVAGIAITNYLSGRDSPAKEPETAISPDTIELKESASAPNIDIEVCQLPLDWGMLPGCYEKQLVLENDNYGFYVYKLADKSSIPSVQKESLFGVAIVWEYDGVSELITAFCKKRCEYGSLQDLNIDGVEVFRGRFYFYLPDESFDGRAHSNGGVYGFNTYSYELIRVMSASVHVAFDPLELVREDGCDRLYVNEVNYIDSDDGSTYQVSVNKKQVYEDCPDLSIGQSFLFDG